jgi:site-specific recombinase XerD
MGGVTLQKALDEYKNIYMPYRNFAERTRVEYLNDLEDLTAFLAKTWIEQVKDLGLPIIERYVAHLEQREFAGSTRKRKVVVIRSFLSFLYQDGHITTDIAKKVILPFAEVSAPHILTQTECDQLRNACVNSIRDSAIIELLLQTGIKLSEITNLTLNDLQLANSTQLQAGNSGFIRVGGRGKGERIIPLNSKASLALSDYLGVKKDNGTSILFLNRFGEPLGERGVQKMLRKYLKRAGIDGASIQTLRHTFGVQHLTKGTSLKTIQDVMGLKDARSTAVYQSLAKEGVAREMQQNAL